MQILQWLFKVAEEEPQRIVSNSTSITKKSRNHEEEEIKGKDIVILISDHKGGKKHVKRLGNSKVSCENLILLRSFYQTLNLKGLGSFEGYRVPLKKREKKKRSEKKGDSGGLGGNKVLPIADSQTQSSSRNENTDSDSKAKKKKKAAVSRMKELLKWAATAKVLKGAGLKAAAANDDLVGDESPKISFRLELENYSHDLHAAGIGNWITTDSEFVVLEL